MKIIKIHAQDVREREPEYRPGVQMTPQELGVLSRKLVEASSAGNPEESQRLKELIMHGFYGD